eukprot:892990-Heterocapsa_arctica.AAC.1
MPRLSNTSIAASGSSCAVSSSSSMSPTAFWRLDSSVPLPSKSAGVRIPGIAAAGLKVEDEAAGSDHLKGS